MRGDFNITAERWTGPNSIPPSVFLTDFPARLVRADQIVFQAGLFWQAQAYLTSENPVVTTVVWSNLGSLVTVFQGTEDQIAVPALGFPKTPILWVETVVPLVGFPYVRYVLGRWLLD